MAGFGEIFEDDYEDKYMDESEAVYDNKYKRILKSKEEYKKGISRVMKTI